MQDGEKARRITPLKSARGLKTCSLVTRPALFLFMPMNRRAFLSTLLSRKSSGTSAASCWTLTWSSRQILVSLPCLLAQILAVANSAVRTKADLPAHPVASRRVWTKAGLPGSGPMIGPSRRPLTTSPDSSWTSAPVFWY